MTEPKAIYDAAPPEQDPPRRQMLPLEATNAEWLAFRQMLPRPFGSAARVCFEYLRALVANDQRPHWRNDKATIESNEPGGEQ